jgi:SAM-dependent methyltransferase
MSSDADDAMTAEFGTVAEWTAEVASRLGPDYAIPAACRGSGKPAALDWLLAGLNLMPGARLVDVGAGLGGPAAYAAARKRVRPLLLEPEQAACRASASLFGRPAIQADATALPLADGRADAAWSLGVLCTLPTRDAQLTALRELRRVVRPGGRIALLVYVAARQPLDKPPDGNRFPTDDDLCSLFRRAGLALLAAADAGRMSAPPAGWRDRTEAVERELHQRFGPTTQLRTSDEQGERIGKLLESGQLDCRLLVLHGNSSPGCGPGNGAASPPPSD